MRELMTADVGVQRTEASLLHAEQELARLTRADAAGRPGAPTTSCSSPGSSPRPRGAGARAAAATAGSTIRRRLAPGDRMSLRPPPDATFRRRAGSSFPSSSRRARRPAQIAALQREIRKLARQRNAVVLAHNYQRPEVQDVADYVGDSLGLSRQAAKTPAERHHLLRRALHGGDGGDPLARQAGAAARPRAGCSLAATITAEDVRRWKAQFPGYIAVGYVNTTAEVKAELDYCCTSGNVLDVIDAIPADKGILFLPDFFLGAHVRRMRPDRRIEVWMGECHVHRGIRAETLNAARAAHPEAEVLVHPECGCAGQLIYEMGQGDVDPKGLHIASTEGMIRAGDGAAGAGVHRRDRDRDHAPDAADGAGQAVHRRRPRGGLRLHEDDHPHRRARLARCSTATTSPFRPTSPPARAGPSTGWSRSGR